MTTETVMAETPASLATSCKVVAPVLLLTTDLYKLFKATKHAYCVLPAGFEGGGTCDCVRLFCPLAVCALSESGILLGSPAKLALCCTLEDEACGLQPLTVPADIAAAAQQSANHFIVAWRPTCCS